MQILTPIANRCGLYKLILGVLQASYITGFFALSSGPHNPYAWGVLIIVQRFLFSAWGFYDLILADVIDSDRVVNARPKSMSTSIHGVQALIVKPSQSVAPIVGVAILSAYGLDSSADGMAAEDSSPQLQSAVFYLTFGVPLVCTALQLLVWRRFDLHGEKLEQVKKSLKDGASDENM